MVTCPTLECSMYISDMIYYNIYKDIENTIGYNNSTKNLISENIDSSIVFQKIIDDIYTQDNIVANISINDAIYKFTKPVVGEYQNTKKIIINILGQSSLNTILKIDPLSINNFPYGYILSQFSPGTIQNIYMDGSYKELSNQSQYYGGLFNISSDNITIQDCVFDDCNYFKIFSYYGQNNVLIQRNRFEGASGADNIGGGSYTNLIVSNNIFNQTSSQWYTGTCLDTVRAIDTIFDNNTINTNQKCIYEGTTGGIIKNNTFNNIEGTVMIVADAGYDMPDHNIINSSGIVIEKNTFNGSYITINSMDHFRNASWSLNSVSPCKDYTIQDNIFSSPYGSSIYTLEDSANTKLQNILIQNNEIYNANASNNSTINTGWGIINPSGINIAHGEYITIKNNTISDNKTIHQMINGIQIGDIYDPSRPLSANHIVIYGNIINGYLNDMVNIPNPVYSYDVIIN